jgi:LmbE family N-acetylglucosaminyl deacetylase
MNKVLVVAVHPDDETLGCGGTLLRHKAEGDEINWLICTELNVKHPMKNLREEEISKVSKMYGFDSVHQLGLETMRVDEYSMSELVEKFSIIFNKVKPTIVYFPFKSDIHSDHRKVFEAAYSCTKSFRYPFLKKILMMETLSETEFAPSLKEDALVPNVFIDVESYLAQKIEIMRVFESEIGAFPFHRSIKNIEALATLRGATSGCEHAESFMLLKEIR